MSGSDLLKGITPAGSGKAGESKEVVWSILGHTYWLKAESDACFIFETLDPPGTFVPPHIHPTQDEFIYMFEGRFDLVIDGKDFVASAGDLIRLPMNIPHGIFNKSDQTVKCFFWVSPTRKLYDSNNSMGMKKNFWYFTMKREMPRFSSAAFSVKAITGMAISGSTSSRLGWA